MKIREVIVCDDVRTEQYNKFSLMGLYGDKIVIYTTDDKKLTPIALPLAIFLRASKDERDADIINFQLDVSNDGKNFGNVKGHFAFKNSTSAALPIRFNTITLLPGELKFSFKFFDKDEKELLSHDYIMHVEFKKKLDKEN